MCKLNQLLIKQNFILAILMNLLISSMAFADSQCGVERFSTLLNLRNSAAHVKASLPALEPSRHAAVARIASLKRQRREIPVDLTLRGQSYDTKNLDTLIKSDNEVGELSLNLDFDLWHESARRKLIVANTHAANTDLEEVENQIAAEILTTALDISQTLSLLDILEARTNLLNNKVEYFELREKLGETVSRDLLIARSDRIENQNKIISARVKLTSLASKINIGLAEAETFPKLSPYETIEGKFGCTFEFDDERNARADLAVAEAELIQKKTNFAPTVSGFVTQSRTRQNRGRIVEEEKIGIDITIPLFSGGKTLNAYEASRDNVSVARRTLSIALEKGERTLTQRVETEFVYQVNAATLESEISKKEDLLNELSERKALGQSVFEEMSDAAIEISRLRESRLSVVQRFFSGWIEFLASANRVNGSDIQL